MYLDEFIAVFKENIPNVLEEDGCIEYYPTIDLPTDIPPQKQDKRVITIIEKWESVENSTCTLLHLICRSIERLQIIWWKAVIVKILQVA